MAGDAGVPIEGELPREGPKPSPQSEPLKPPETIEGTKLQGWLDSLEGPTPDPLKEEETKRILREAHGILAAVPPEYQAEVNKMIYEKARREQVATLKRYLPELINTILTEGPDVSYFITVDDSLPMDEAVKQAVKDGNLVLIYAALVSHVAKKTPLMNSYAARDGASRNLINPVPLTPEEKESWQKMVDEQEKIYQVTKVLRQLFGVDEGLIYTELNKLVPQTPKTAT